MKGISQAIVDELAAFLDHQSGHLRNVLECLDEFRKALIRRDLPVLQAMQTQLAGQADIRLQMDQTQRAIQQKLADVLSCREEEVCLSAVCRRLDRGQQEIIQTRRKGLADLVQRLRQQHLATELLLRECARMNRRLLETVTGTRAQGKTYDARGRSSWSLHPGLMSVKL